MANKYSYTLLVQKRNSSLMVEIKNPFTIVFDVKKTNFNGANMLTLKVYNLGLSTRESIRKDQLFNVDQQQNIVFSCGMNGQEPIVFDGNVLSCSSGKEGNNIVTSITAVDNGLPKSTISRRSYSSGTPKQVIIDDLISDLAFKGIQRGFISPTSGVIKRGMSIFQDPVSALSIITENRFFIENKRANIPGENQPIPSTVRRLTSSNIIGSPTSQNSQIFIETMFYPSLVIGQDLDIDSKVNPQYNGVARVFMINHKGTISDGVKTSVTTQIGLRFDIRSDVYKRLRQ